MTNINPGKKYKLYNQIKNLLLKLRTQSQNHDIVGAWDSMIYIVESVKNFWMNNNGETDGKDITRSS